MRNYTSKLIEEARKKISHLNAVQTRNMSKTKKEREKNPPQRNERGARETEDKKKGDSNPMMDGLSSPEREEMNATIDEKKDDILGALEDNEKVPLAKIKSEEFETEQKNCISLSKIWKMAEDVNNKEFEVRKDRLIRISHSKRGIYEVIQYREFRRYHKA